MESEERITITPFYLGEDLHIGFSDYLKMKKFFELQDWEEHSREICGQVIAEMITGDNDESVNS